MIKGYIDENQNTLFVCPYCGFQKHFNVSQFNGKRKNLTIKCQCGKSTEFQIEFRQSFRKTIGIPGVCIFDKTQIRCDVIIRDISLGGVGLEFVFVNKRYLAQIKIGDIIVIEFKLNHKKEKILRKRCIIRLKLDSIIGAEFTDENYSRDVGFFMMN